MPQVMKKGRLPLFKGTYKECENYMIHRGIVNNPRFTIVGVKPKSEPIIVEDNTLVVIKPTQIKRGFWTGTLNEL